jgi:hypothetical protein
MEGAAAAVECCFGNLRQQRGPGGIEAPARGIEGFPNTRMYRRQVRGCLTRFGSRINAPPREAWLGFGSGSFRFVVFI